VKNFAIFLIIILILGLQGCSKTWFVDFTVVDNIDNWKKQDWGISNTFELSSDGLFIDGKVLTAPVGFKGDFTLIILFSLKTAVSSTIPYMNFVLAGSGDAPYSEYVNCVFFGIGDTSIESYLVSSAEPFLSLANGEAISEMERTGLNTFKLVKKGSNIKVFINNRIICDAQETSYSN